MVGTIVFLFFPAAMAAAACIDFFTLTIPNRLSIGFAVLFFPAALVAGLPLHDIGMHVLAAAAMLAVGVALFAFGWIGGGDAKFFAATALWLGWPHLLPYIVWFSLVGGGLSLALVVARRMPIPLLVAHAEWALRLHDRRNGVPYGVALAAAGLIVYPATIWTAVMTG